MLSEILILEEMNWVADQYSKFGTISKFLVWNYRHSEIHEGSLNKNLHGASIHWLHFKELYFCFKKICLYASSAIIRGAEHRKSKHLIKTTRNQHHMQMNLLKLLLYSLNLKLALLWLNGPLGIICIYLTALRLSETVSRRACGGQSERVLCRRKLSSES